MGSRLALPLLKPRAGVRRSKYEVASIVGEVGTARSMKIEATSYMYRLPTGFERKKSPDASPDAAREMTEEQAA